MRLRSSGGRANSPRSLRARIHGPSGVGVDYFPMVSKRPGIQTSHLLPQARPRWFLRPSPPPAVKPASGIIPPSIILPQTPWRRRLGRIMRGKMMAYQPARFLATHRSLRVFSPPSDPNLLDSTFGLALSHKKNRREEERTVGILAHSVAPPARRGENFRAGSTPTGRRQSARSLTFLYQTFWPWS